MGGLERDRLGVVVLRAMAIWGLGDTPSSAMLLGTCTSWGKDWKSRGATLGLLYIKCCGNAAMMMMMMMMMMMWLLLYHCLSFALRLWKD